MEKTTRKTLFVMLGIIAAEGFPMALTFGQASPQAVGRLYFHGSALGWSAAIVIVIGYVAYSIRSLPLIGARFFDLHPLKALAVPFSVISGTMEELWFRRGAMDWVQARGIGWMGQLAFAAVLFGLVHAIWGVFAGRWRVAITSMVATSALGAALAGAYLLGGRQVAPCVWAHLAINLAIEPWLLIAAISVGKERVTIVGSGLHST
jgi:hypothetical protein